jgi:hypothetical protein
MTAFTSREQAYTFPTNEVLHALGRPEQLVPAIGPAPRSLLRVTRTGLDMLTTQLSAGTGRKRTHGHNDVSTDTLCFFIFSNEESVKNITDIQKNVRDKYENLQSRNINLVLSAKEFAVRFLHIAE